MGNSSFGRKEFYNRLFSKCFSRNYCLLIALLSSSALLLPAPLMAQSAGDNDAATVLKKITVEGAAGDAALVAKTSSTSSKTDTPLLDAPASVSVVTEAEMKQRGVETLDDALAYTPGVSTDIYGSDNRYDHYFIRGFYQTTNGSYRDGLPMRTGGDFTNSRMEPYGMERLDVLKGSNSTLFGLSSPGGIVNAITKTPESKKFGEVYTTFGDGHVETGTDFGGPIDAEGIWSYRITGKWQNADAGIDHTSDDRLYIAPALTWSPDADTSFTILTDYNKRNGSTSHGIPLGSGYDPESYFGEPDFDNMDTIERNIGYQFRHDFGNGLVFRQNARYTDLDLTYEGVYNAPTDPTVSRSALAVYGHSKRFQIDNQLQYDASFGRFDSRTLFGADYGHDANTESRQDGSQSVPGVGSVAYPVYCGRACALAALGAATITDSTLATMGVYMQEELTLDNRWILTLGGRYDHLDTESESSGVRTEAVDTNFSKRAGITFKATDEISLYANYSESFLPVSANRTYFLTAPKPQEGNQYEVGVKYQPEGMDALFTISAFDLTQKNVTQGTNIGPTYTQFQIGEVNVKGIELEAKMALTSRINLTAGYSYWDAKIKNDLTSSLIGNRPELVPNNMASLWVDYTIPGNDTFNDLTIGAGARFIGKTYGDNANAIPLGSRTVFDASVNYKFSDSLALAVNATNLFDKQYVASVDDYSLAAFYGDRRTVKATLRYTW
jgi:iron complex outermembrane receptor protein